MGTSFRYPVYTRRFPCLSVANVDIFKVAARCHKLSLS
jgi:hypothetical protein